MPTKEKTREALVQVICDEINVKPEECVDDADLTMDLGADSLDIVELAMAIEDAFGVDIKDEHLQEIRTFGDLARHIGIA